MAADLEIAIFVGAEDPFDEADLSVDQFNAGDAVRMDTGAGVDIALAFTLRKGKGGAVRMPGGEIGMVGARPVFQARADRSAPLIVFGCAGRILDTGQFQRPPEITDKPAGDLPELIVQQVSLMSVQQMDAPSADRVFEDQGFGGGRQETGSRTGRRAKPGTAFDAVVITP